MDSGGRLSRPRHRRVVTQPPLNRGDLENPSECKKKRFKFDRSTDMRWFNRRVQWSMGVQQWPPTLILTGTQFKKKWVWSPSVTRRLKQSRAPCCWTHQLKGLRAQQRAALEGSGRYLLWFTERLTGFLYVILWKVRMMLSAPAARWGNKSSPVSDAEGSELCYWSCEAWWLLLSERDRKQETKTENAVEEAETKVPIEAR